MMQRITCPPRPDWQRRVEEKGLHYHTASDGQPYWFESAYYQLTGREIDALEKAAYELDRLCLAAVEHIIDHDRWDEFGVPKAFRSWVAQSWESDEVTIYGRFDLLYDGTQPPKLAEYNADTPTALLEAAVIQWFWLEDTQPHADQFNTLHERLLEVWGRLQQNHSGLVHFSALNNMLEDYLTATYLRDLAMQAGLPTEYLPVESIGWNQPRQRFVDLLERPIELMFKLYPWEWLLREEFATRLPAAPTRWLEPPWKMLLSNKALLSLLWELNPGHPNLLPTAHQPLSVCQVRKPVHGREGANVAILDGPHTVLATDGPYDAEPCVYQEFFPTPRYDGHSIVLGVWMVNGHACGLGIREDESLITRNTSRFVPHLFR